MPITIILFVLVVFLTLNFLCKISDIKDELHSLRTDKHELKQKVFTLELDTECNTEKIRELRKKIGCLEDYLNVHFHGEEVLPAKYVKNK